MSGRRILTQREQWPFRCATGEADEGNPVKPIAPSSTPALPKIPGMPKLPGQLGGDYNSWQQKQQGQPLDPPGHPSRGPAQPGDLKNLPSVEAAGITDVDYSHLPQGEPMTGFSPGGGGSGGPGGFGGAGGSSSAPLGTGPTPPATGPAPASGDAAGMKNRIRTDITPQLQQRGITDPAAVEKAVNSIYQQGITESGWRDVPQAITDVNSQKGTPAQSYLQYVPSTFEHAQDLAGTPKNQRNIHDLDQQIRGVIPLEESEGKFGPGGFSDSSGSGVGYGHGWG